MIQGSGGVSSWDARLLVEAPTSHDHLLKVALSRLLEMNDDVKGSFRVDSFDRIFREVRLAS